MSTETPSLTLGQWCQHIQYEIRHLHNLSKNVFAHRTKLTNINNQLRTFSNSLRSMTSDDRTLTSEEAEKMDKLMQIIGEFKNIFQQQTDSGWLQYFMENPPYKLAEDVNKLKKDFNDTVISLGLSSNPPLFCTEIQEKNENVHDLGIIQQLLENMNIQGIDEKYNEVKALREKLSEELGTDADLKKPKTLELSEIKESLQSLEQWEIDPDDLELQKKHASGGFGEVYLGYRKSDGTMVAIKRLHNQQLDENALEMFKSEVAILAKLKHFAILPFVGACTKPPFCIITRFMSGGSLFSRLHAKDEADRLSATQLSIIALGIAYGMEYLHDQQMVHRDLKSLNILLDADDFPKICDFGMARTKGSGSEVVGGGIGTSQWMAPEVLISQRFDEKADVYSYGIIMWEMLTGDVPYRGMRDIQVAMTVINQGNRPKIPKNCPQNLAKFIRLCWNTDPDRRPDFHQIVRTLESGAISFPGTDISKLKAYVNQFASPGKTTSTEVVVPPMEVDPNSVTEEQLSKMIDVLRAEDGAIAPLLNAVQNPDVVQMLAQFDIMSVISTRITNSTDVHAISLLVALVHTLIMDEAMLQSFLEHSGAKLLLDILVRFSTSSIPRLVDCLLKVSNSERCIYTSQHMGRLAQFLLLSDLSVRRSTIELINLIIDRQCFDDDSIFAAVVENLLRNAVPEAKNQILLETLEVLIKITQFEAAKAQFRCVEGPDRITTLMMHDDQTILATALRLLQLLFEGTTPKQRTISAFLDKFTSVIQRADSDGQLEALNALAMLMDNTLIYKEVSACETFSSSFAHCINSEDAIVQVSALRICFAFCSNTITENVFLPLLPDLKRLLKSSTYPAIISAFSIAALLALHDPGKVLGDDAQEIRSFVEHALALESELTSPALRLVGVLASSMSGASFLNQWNVMPKVAGLMQSRNDELAHLAVMAMTAMSAASPDSEVMHDSIQKLLEASKDPSFGYYPLVCLSNITVDPRNAVACIPYVNDLLDAAADPYGDRMSKQRALVTLHRIINTREAVTQLNSSEFIHRLLESVGVLWGSEHAPVLFSIVESLTVTESACKELKVNGMMPIVEEHLAACPISDPNRPKLIRIHSRLNAVKE